MVTKTTEELDEMRNLIAQGQLPPDAIEKYYEAEAKNVFGHDAKRKRGGGYVEQGYGAPGHQTANSVAAYRKYGKDEPDFAENLKRMEAELAETNKRRAERAA